MKVDKEDKKSNDIIEVNNNNNIINDFNSNTKINDGIKN